MFASSTEVRPITNRGSVDERQGPGVVVDGREVLDAADEDALGQLADRAVAVGPVVRVLGRGPRRPDERGEQARRR